jgi:hypothetical protein
MPALVENPDQLAELVKARGSVFLSVPWISKLFLGPDGGLAFQTWAKAHRFSYLLNFEDLSLRITAPKPSAWPLSGPTGGGDIDSVSLGDPADAPSFFPPTISIAVRQPISGTDLHSEATAHLDPRTFSENPDLAGRVVKALLAAVEAHSRASDVALPDLGPDGSYHFVDIP